MSREQAGRGGWGRKGSVRVPAIAYVLMAIGFWGMVALLRASFRAPAPVVMEAPRRREAFLLPYRRPLPPSFRPYLVPLEPAGAPYARPRPLGLAFGSPRVMLVGSSSTGGR